MADGEILNWKTRALHSPLLGEDTGLPVHHYLSADLGHCFFWEQRYFLTALQVRDHVDFRKRETRRDDTGSLVLQWGLLDTDAPGTDHAFLKTRCMSSALLVPWLFLQVIHSLFFMIID